VQAEAPHVDGYDPRSREIQRHWRNHVVRIQLSDAVHYYVQNHPPFSCTIPETPGLLQEFEWELSLVGARQYPDRHDKGRVVVQLPTMQCDAVNINPAAIYHFNGGPPIQILAYKHAVSSLESRGPHMPLKIRIPPTGGNKYASAHPASPARHPQMVRWPNFPTYRWELQSASIVTTKGMPPLLKDKSKVMGWMDGPADIQRSRTMKPPPYIRCVVITGLELLAFVLSVTRMSGLTSEPEAGASTAPPTEGWALALKALRPRLVLWLGNTQANRMLSEGIKDGTWAALMHGRNLQHSGPDIVSVSDVTTWAYSQAVQQDRVLLVNFKGDVTLESEDWFQMQQDPLQLLGILEEVTKRALVRTSHGVKLLRFTSDFKCRGGDQMSTVTSFRDPWFILVRTDVSPVQACCALSPPVNAVAYWCARCAAAVSCRDGRHRWNNMPSCKGCALLEESPEELCSRCTNSLSGPTTTCTNCSAVAHQGCTDSWFRQRGRMYCPSPACMPWARLTVLDAQARCAHTNCGDVDWALTSSQQCGGCARLVCMEHAANMSSAGLCRICTTPEPQITPKTPTTPHAGPGPRKGEKRARRNV
jgi:hypothetical protein